MLLTSNNPTAAQRLTWPEIGSGLEDADLARHDRKAGAHRFILEGVIEDRVEIARHITALAVDRLFVFRLTVGASVVHVRLAIRYANDPTDLEWHLSRRRELAAILDSAALDDLIVHSTNLTPTQIAAAVGSTAGWKQINAQS